MGQVINRTGVFTLKIVENIGQKPKIVQESILDAMHPRTKELVQYAQRRLAIKTTTDKYRKE